MTPLERIEKALAEIEAREKAATPGPWETDPETQQWRVSGGICYTKHLLGEDTEESQNNRIFTAAARTDIPALVAALREAVEYLVHVNNDRDVQELKNIADKLEGK